MACRTARLDCLVRHLALALGGRPAARFADRLGLPVSIDTLLRTVRRYDRPSCRWSATTRGDRCCYIGRGTGQRSQGAAAILEQLPPARFLLADRAYSSAAFRQALTDQGITPRPPLGGAATLEGMTVREGEPHHPTCSTDREPSGSGLISDFAETEGSSQSAQVSRSRMTIWRS